MHGLGGKYARPREQPAKRMKVGLVARAGAHICPDRVADRDVAAERGVDATAHGRAGVAEELDPRGGIDQDYVARP